MNHPRMTYRGRAIAGLIGAVIALSLPKRVDCEYPGADTTKCGRLNALHRWCTRYEVEPLLFYMLEHVFSRDIGFAYSSGEECR